MISLDEFCKKQVLNKYLLPTQEFKTFDEFLDINNINENNITEDAVNFYYNFNINSSVNRHLTDYSEDINEFETIRKSGGYIYHITKKELKDKIQKTGLRPKVGKTVKEGGYRYFPECIYFVKNTKDKSELKDKLQTIIQDKGYKEYIIIKVKLGNHEFPLYKDTAYDENNNIYTYTAIPPKLITIYDDIEQL